jgi:hypothetical protein
LLVEDWCNRIEEEKLEYNNGKEYSGEGVYKGIGMPY